MEQSFFSWRAAVLLVAFEFSLCGSAQAGFAEGVAAYGKGDYVTAFSEFRALAEQGNEVAYHNLAMMYESGKGVPIDEQQALYWYRKAADRGLAADQVVLGGMYSEGRVIPKDESLAAYWYRKAAIQGNDIAQFNLAVRYAIGKGVPRDEQQAVGWYRIAAMQGNAGAQFNLGVMYSDGRGVAKDEQLSAQWYRKSADQGNAFAQHNLGVMYSNGRGVPKDEQQAYFWWLLASAQGLEQAKQNRDIMERTLSSGQRAEAQANARSWAPKKTVSPPLASNHEAPDGSARPPAVVAPTGPTATGSGWAVSRTQLITNAHVVQGCGRVLVAGRGVARLQAVDARSDLALLAVSDNPSPASLRAGRLRQGDAVTVVGYPLRGVLASGANVTAGNISALAGMQNDSRFIQISAPVQPGNSGGPLLDSSGNVVGVVVSKLNALKVAQMTGDIPQNVNFAVSLFTLQSFLEANAVDYVTVRSNKNLSTADVAAIGKRFTYLLECYP